MLGYMSSEALEQSSYGLHGGRLMAHIAFDEHDVAGPRRKAAAQPATRQIDDAEPPTRGNESKRDGAPDSVRPTGDQGDAVCAGHVRRGG